MALREVEKIRRNHTIGSTACLHFYLIRRQAPLTLLPDVKVQQNEEVDITHLTRLRMIAQKLAKPRSYKTEVACPSLLDGVDHTDLQGAFRCMADMNSKVQESSGVRNLLALFTLYSLYRLVRVIFPPFRVARV